MAPEIVEASLAGRHPAVLTIAKSMTPFPGEWSEQIAGLS